MAALLVLALLGLGACAHEMSSRRIAPGAPPEPAIPWTPPADLPPPSRAETPPPPIPPDLIETMDRWTLPDLVDLALRNSPTTRESWARARAAAAELGGEKGSRYPTIDGQVNAVQTRGAAVGGQFIYEATATDPFIQLEWLLLDFGGRKAATDAARQALIAADYAHNAAIQDVVLQVEEATHQYLYARALEASERAAVREAEAGLDAAEQRREAGVATIADVLQARTRLSQAQLALQTVQGQTRTVRGALATAVGLPANTEFDVPPPSGDLPLDDAAVAVERAIRDAQERRPELAGARAEVERAEADLREQKAAFRPRLTASTNAGRIYYGPFASNADTYTASLLLTIPIYSGGRRRYNVFRAEADRDAAVAELDALSQQITLEVWTAYYDHQTAIQQVRSSADLVDSAAQSHEVAEARYRSGVGTILDLLTAQQALESARAQEASARAAWSISLARFAHATGGLWRSAPDRRLATDARLEDQP